MIHYAVFHEENYRIFENSMSTEQNKFKKAWMLLRNSYLIPKFGVLLSKMSKQ